ncbi:MAG: hypothetical protein IPK97_00240 [Ahniella sp.]|nr:hypothetical protein [Ahniella sp.]
MNRIVRVVLFGMLGWVLMTATVAAQSVVPVPASGGPGTTVTADLDGLTSGFRYRLYLEESRPSVVRVEVADFTASGSSVIRKVVIPANAVPGAQFLVLYRVSIGETQLDSTAFTVQTPPVITFPVATIAQGRALRFTVSPLRAGTLTVKFDGETVLGPINVGDGTFQGKFVVPRDRPAVVPGTVEIRAENRIGRNLVGVAKAIMRVTAPSGLPAISASFSQNPPTTSNEGARMTFTGRIADQDGFGVSGQTNFYWRGTNGRIVPIDGNIEMAADGTYSASARAPSAWLDGVGPASGEVVAVVRDTDPDTDTPRSQYIATGRNFTTINSFQPGNSQFLIKLVGRNGLGQLDFIENAYVEVLGGLDTAFSDPRDNNPPPGDEDALFAVEHQMSVTQSQVGGGVYANAFNGCPLTFARKFTDDEGEAPFEYDKEALLRLSMMAVIREMGEIRMINKGLPIPGIDTFENPGGALRGTTGQSVSLVVQIHAGQRGYGETGQIDEDNDPATPTTLGYQPTDISVRVDLDTGELTIDSGPQFGGSASVIGGVILVELPSIPIGNTAVPRNLRIAGLQNPSNGNFGKKKFKGMFAFPNAQRFPDSAFVARNQGREMRFEWESGLGAVQSATLLLKRPGDSSLVYYGQFTIDPETACTVSGLVEYTAPLPDLTRLGENACYQGRIVVDRNPGTNAEQMFEICTVPAPADLDARNSEITLSINGLATPYQPMFFGSLQPTEQGVIVEDNNMQEYGIPRQDNVAANAGDYSYRLTNSFFLERIGGLSTDHVIGSNDTDAADSYGTLFGFDPDVQALANVEQQTILDTGKIPLFRYPWGAPPIAGATLGADFWLASELGFYGAIGGPTGNPMDASIDPSLAGGVDMFFDLEVLFGLVSASVTASPNMGLLMRNTIGDGGLAPNVIQNSGVCYDFRLDISIEICAVICGEDTFNAVTVEEGNACSIANKTWVEQALDRGSKSLRLPRPKLYANALAVDGYGRQLVVRVDSLGRLRASHFDAGGNEVVRTIDSSTVAVQNLDVIMFSGGRALAVWSESSLTTAQARAIMELDGVRFGSDDLARAQVLNYSRFDGTSWSVPAPMPTSQPGVGRPRLAACRALIGCLRGEIGFLVWEYDRNRNIAAPDIEIWGAEWRNGSFGPRIQISAAGSSSDMAPDLVYLGTQPVVAWVHNPLGQYNGLAQRQIAYRILDETTVAPRNAQQIPPLPVGASWPSLTANLSSTLTIAYTISTDGVSVLGNRNALQVARGQCDAVRCVFDNTEPRDPYGRKILGERPRVELDADGMAVVSFRGLGFGGTGITNVARTDDPIGMLIGSGEHITVRVPSFATATVEVAVTALSSNGLQHWRPDFAFDPSMNAFIAISQQAALPGGVNALDFVKRLRGGKELPPTNGKALGDGLTLRSLADLPDLRIESSGISGTYWIAGQAGNARIVVRNAGADYNPAVHGASELRLTWDAPAGGGISASVVSIPAMIGGAELTFNRSVTTPAGHQSDEVRSLFVDIVPVRGSVFDDASSDDNRVVITKGEMPVPTGLGTRTKPNSPIVGLDWLAPNDPRVAGYRVYKRAENGEFLPYGSSPVSGFADFFAGFRNKELYRVTSYSARGIESAPSEVSFAQPEQAAGIFGNGFE